MNILMLILLLISIIGLIISIDLYKAYACLNKMTKLPTCSKSCFIEKQEIERMRNIQINMALGRKI